MAELRGSYSSDTAKPAPKKKKAAQYNTFRDNPAVASAPKQPAPAPVKQAQPGGLFGPLLKVLQSK